MFSGFFNNLFLDCFYKLIQWKNIGFFFSMKTERNAAVIFFIESDNQQIRYFLHLTITHTFTRIRLPEIIGNTLSAVGSMIGPASMFVTGMLFAGMNMKQIFANKRVYFISFLRLIAVPLFSLVLLKISHLASLSADGNQIMLIVFLAVITPSASTITQMCQVYGNDSRYASAINVVTTLFSIITMPLMVMLFQMIL